MPLISNAAPRAVLVTGSSRGLGRGVALELAKAGYSVAVHYSSNEAAAAETVGLCREASPGGARFEAFSADIADVAQVRSLAERVFERFGPLFALVNNAGIAPKVRADILDATPESFDELVSTNARGPYFLTQAVARLWLATPAIRPSARSVIFITSISAETASVNRGDYCVSKAALSMAAKLWAARLAPEGIQVCELRPGIMATDMTSGVKAKYDALIAAGLVPQGRWGEPSDVGKAVRAVLDGAFPFSAGAVIDVDGGFHISRL